MKQSKRNRNPRSTSVKRLTVGIATAGLIGLGASVANAHGWGPQGSWGPQGMMANQGMMNQGMMGQGMMGRGMMGPGMMGQGGGMQPGQFVEGRLAFLKAELGITESQQQSWDEFAGFMRTQAGSMQSEMTQHQAEWQQRMQRMQTAGQANQSPVELMKNRITHMQERSAKMQAGLDAMKKLYAVLTPEQQAKANNLLGHHMM